MAFSIPWLETVSKRERQRREEKAQKLMFPFGDEQRTAELAVLRALIQTKARDADLLYQLFQAKADASGPSLSFLPPAAAQAATVGGASNSRVSPLRVIGHPTFPSSQ